MLADPKSWGKLCSASVYIQIHMLPASVMCQILSSLGFDIYVYIYTRHFVLLEEFDLHMVPLNGIRLWKQSETCCDCSPDLVVRL